MAHRCGVTQEVEGMNCKLTPTVIPAFALVAALGVHAAPITTVPWNGYPGAVTFTYDDARESQLPNLIPQLDALGIKATFFVPQAGVGDLVKKKADWLKVAKNGHELANHTYSHQDVAGASGGIAQMATYLRAMDPSIQSVTFAYPNCNEGAQTQVSAENFIARDCGDVRYTWASEPSNWMLHQGLILSKNAESGVTAINDAKNNKWATIVVHDVVNNPPDWSLSVADNKKLLDQAVANKLWIGTYQEVGAYYRAHFTMDKVTASGAGPWNLTWTSPHAKMPKSVKLKVKLDAATFGTGITVSQDNVTIPANTDGSYTIDFMKLKMNVVKGASGIAPSSRPTFSFGATATPDGIRLDGVSGDVEAHVTDLRGASLFNGPVSDRRIALGQGSRGILVVSLTDRASGAVAQKLVNTTR
jgi:hypothetical protein